MPRGVATPLVGLERLESGNPNLLNPKQVAHAMLEIAQQIQQVSVRDQSWARAAHPSIRLRTHRGISCIKGVTMKFSRQTAIVGIGATEFSKTLDEHQCS